MVTVHYNESQVNSKYKLMKTIRVLNFIGTCVFMVLTCIEGIQYLGGYFLITIYFWIFLLYLIVEIKFVIINRYSLKEKYANNWLAISGIISVMYMIYFINRYKLFDRIFG